MRLASDQTVDGLNGELTFNPAVLTNPRVAPAAGATGYTAAGNQTTAGTFRFLLFKDPPDASLNLAQPVIDFLFDVVAGYTLATDTQVNFTLAAAAHRVPGNPPNVISIGRGGPGGNPPPKTVAFQSFTVRVNYVPTPTITVTKPKRGEQWVKGQPYRITWIFTGDIGSRVTINLYKGHPPLDKKVATLFLSTDAQRDAPNYGRKSWTPPAYLTPGNDYRIKVKSATNGSIFDYTKYFSIVDASQGTGESLAGGAHAAPPVLESARDIGDGAVQLIWSATQTPARFLGFGWDVYEGQWAAPGSDGSMWAAFPPSATSGTLRLNYSGGYHLWISSQFADGRWLPCENPWTGILYSGAPHAPAGVRAEALGPRRVRLHWDADVYGAWQYQIAAWNAADGWITTAGPSATGHWRIVDFNAQAFAPGTADFAAGWADFELPSPGEYTFLIRAIGWLPPYPAGECATDSVFVAP